MKFEITEFVPRPVEAVFALLGDYLKDPVWRAECVSAVAVEGDGRLASVIDYENKPLGQRQVTRSYVNAYTENERVGFEATGGAPARGWRTFESVEGGTRVTCGYDIDFEALFGPAGAMVAALFQRDEVHYLGTARLLLENPALLAGLPA